VFEQDSGDVTRVTVSGSNVSFLLQLSGKRIIGVQNANASFVLTGQGIIGAVADAVLLAPDFGGDITLSGIASMRINTTTESKTLTVGTHSIDVTAASSGSFYVRVELSAAAIAVMGNSLTADSLVFEKNGATVDVSGTNMDFLLAAGAKRIIGIDNANFAFRFTAKGIAGAVSAASYTGPDLSGITLQGALRILINTTDDPQTFANVGGSSVTVTAATAGSPYFRAEILTSTLTVLGNSLTMDRLVLEKNGTEVSVSGDHLDFLLQAGTTRIMSLTDGDFAFVFTESGIAGAVSVTTFQGPDLADVTVTGSVSLVVNTGTTARTFTVNSHDYAAEASTVGGYVRVDVTSATLVILSNSFTADSLVFEKNGSDVLMSGENMGLVLSAGSKRIIGISNADFVLRFTASGMAGALVNAAVTGPELTNISLSGIVSVWVNTLATSQTLLVGGQTVEVDAASGSGYVRVMVDSGSLSVYGNTMTAERFSLELAGSTVTVSGTGLDFKLLAGTTQVIGLENADFAFVFTANGVAGALAHGSLLLPDFSDDIVIGGDTVELTVMINTTTTAYANLAGVAVEAASAGGFFIRAKLKNAILKILGVAVSADSFTFAYRNDASDGQVKVDLAAENLSLAMGDGSTDFLTVTSNSVALTFTSEGISGTISQSTVTAHVPGVTFTGVFTVTTDTTSATAKAVKVTGTGISLTMAGQTIAGNVVIEQLTDESGTRRVRVAGTSMSLTFGGGVAGVTGGQGLFVFNSLGLAGTFDATAYFNLPGVVLADTAVTIEVNTTSVPVNDSMTLSGSTVSLSLPAGPYVRIRLTHASLTISGTQITGNFAIDQSKRADLSTITRIAVSGASLTYSGNGIANAEGAFIVVPQGVAGTISGDVTVGVDGFSVGGSIGLRINTTALSFDEDIVIEGSTIHVKFTAPAEAATNGTPYFMLFGSDMTLSIGGFVTIEGKNIQFTGNSFSGSGLTLFMGKGPALVKSDTDPSGFVVSPSARGFLLSNATIGLLRVSGTYALYAEGTVTILGAGSGVTLAGTAIITFNNTGSDQTLSIAGGASQSVLNNARSFSGNLTLTVLGQSLAGTFSLSQVTTDKGDKMLSLFFTDVTLSMGGVVTISQSAGESGFFVMGSQGIAGTMSAHVTVSASADVTFGSGFSVSVNTMPAAVSQSGTVTIAETDHSFAFDLPSGSYFRVSGTNLTLTVYGQTFKGDFAIEKSNAGDVAVIASNVSVSLGSGASPFLNVTGGSGIFLIAPTGIAGSLKAALSVTVPGVTFAGTFEIRMNTMATGVTQSFTIGTENVSIDFSDSGFLSVAGTDVAVSVSGQTLTGDLTFDLKTGTSSQVTVAFANVTLNLGDGSTSLVKITGGHGSFTLTPVKLSGSAVGTVTVNPVTGITLSGTFSVAIDGKDVTITGGTAGTPASLTLSGQTLSGIFSLKKPLQRARITQPAHRMIRR
jgi:hypothetical protein